MCIKGRILSTERSSQDLELTQSYCSHNKTYFHLDLCCVFDGLLKELLTTCGEEVLTELVQELTTFFHHFVHFSNYT